MDVSAILTAHHEGIVAGLSLRSMLDAVRVARDDGLTVEVLVVLDNPNVATQRVFADAEEHGWKVEEVAFGDQGLVRNHAVAQAEGDYVAFLDGDDLWSENWLRDAHRLCASGDGRTIAHPEVDWLFGRDAMDFFHVDQADPDFDPHFLRIGNYWDALCLAPRSAYLEHPFSRRDVPAGFAFEDWHWNMETMSAGYVHRVVPETIHFKRRRQGSQTHEAAGNRCIPRPSRFQTYAAAAEWDAR